MSSEESKSKGIQSIEVGVDILKKIAEADKPLSITEIANLCDTSKSKLHRYLTSFIRTGMLEKSEDAKYTLGAELIMLGLSASQKLNITDIVAPHLIEVKNRLNETAALAIWGEGGPFFISWEESNRPINIGIKVGSRVGVTQSASGRVFAAYLPSHLTAEQISRELSKNSISEDQLQEYLNTIREKEYSYVISTIVPGISAIAAPIFDHTSQVIAVLTVVGLENSLDISESSEAVKLLKEKTIEISRLLGAPIDTLQRKGLA
ncbi:IclR family transcriptional regulator [Sporosarcina soli]|uniref:IclR family transcriptional regulator n=1 Tax=Sporosarcina soli TaxID=334736 RepID=A0ABW0TIS7_9BACL